MNRVKRIRAYFNKDKFNYSEGPVDPYEFHKTFYYLCKLFRVIDNEPIPKWTLPVVITFGACASIAGALCCISFINYVCIFEVPLMTETGTYFIIMAYKLMIVVSSFTERRYYGNFFQAMRDDFEYICTKGSRYRERFFKNHLWTWKASISSSLFIAFTGGGILICANLALVYFLVYPTEDSIRPLPFPFCVNDVDFGKSPVYEITFIFSCVCTCTHTVTYTFMMQTQVVWIRQIISKADVIIWSIQDLLIDIVPTNNMQQKAFYEKIIEARMREIIKMHHSMYSLLDDYAAVYTKMLMFEQKMCAPIVCLCAYCSAEKLDAGEIPGNMALLCLSATILIGIPSCMCTILAEKVQSIGDACWDTPFWNAPGKAVRPYFVLMMQRSMRPLPIQAPGFEEVSLQTFSDKIRFAYTGFNMLRQVNYD